jgi:hypothetical protein
MEQKYQFTVMFETTVNLDAMPSKDAFVNLPDTYKYELVGQSAVAVINKELKEMNRGNTWAKLDVVGIDRYVLGDV